jgi:hypothetical protein
MSMELLHWLNAFDIVLFLEEASTLVGVSVLQADCSVIDDAERTRRHCKQGFSEDCQSCLAHRTHRNRHHSPLARLGMGNKGKCRMCACFSWNA